LYVFGVLTVSLLSYGLRLVVRLALG